MISKISASLAWVSCAWVSYACFSYALFSCAGICLAQTPAPTHKAAAHGATTAEAQIREVLDRQAFDWNRGDTDGYLIGYAPDCVYVADKIIHGLDELRVRYQSHYPTRAAMGELSFSGVEVHMIDADNAYVIGQWRLKRDADGGGDTNGMYTLLFKKTVKGWKIVLDHTS